MNNCTEIPPALRNIIERRSVLPPHPNILTGNKKKYVVFGMALQFLVR